MRVIDQPMEDSVILGSESGGLYVCAAGAWMSLYAGEYESEGIQVTWVQPGLRQVTLATMPPLSRQQPTPLVEEAFVGCTERYVSLQPYACGHVIRLYGFDGETTTFFVSQGSS